MKNTNTNTKLILLHPYIQKQGSSNRLWLLALVSILTLAFLVTLISTRESTFITTATSSVTPSSNNAPVSGFGSAPLPATVINTLLHYASKSNDTFHMPHSDLKPISDVLRKCSSQHFLSSSSSLFGSSSSPIKVSSIYLSPL